MNRIMKQSPHRWYENMVGRTSQTDTFVQIGKTLLNQATVCEDFQN